LRVSSRLDVRRETLAANVLTSVFSIFLQRRFRSVGKLFQRGRSGGGGVDAGAFALVALDQLLELRQIIGAAPVEAD
jgi:hypothetical protein